MTTKQTQAHENYQVCRPIPQRSTAKSHVSISFLRLLEIGYMKFLSPILEANTDNIYKIVCFR